MTPVSTIRLEQNLKARTAKATAGRKKTVVKLKPGQKRVQSKEQAAEAKKLVESAVSPKRSKAIAKEVAKKIASERPVPVLKASEKPAAKHFALLAERDVPSYDGGVIDTKCPRCGSGKGIPCVHPGKRLGYAHAQRKSAAKEAK
jgi:hypothetical protein